MKLFELKSPAEVQQLEVELDKLMRSVGLDVEFSRHFIERLLGRDRSITGQEVIASFDKLKRKYKQKLLKYKKTPGHRAILKDFDSELNVIFGVQASRNKDKLPELVNITIMRKDPDKFRTDTPSGSGEELKVGTRR